MPEGELIGTVVALWRYPVKSMMGEELNASLVTERGLAGDRAYALIDQETGKVASAKYPRKWARLFDFRAAYVEEPPAGGRPPDVRITFPDGQLLESREAALGARLSSLLGREVRLTTAALTAPSLEEYWPDIEGLAHREAVTDEAMPPGTFFDLAVVHLLTTTTIDALRSLYPQSRFEARRFRPNIIIEPADGRSGFVEDDWVGRTLAIGDALRLSISGPCPRCVMTTLPQGDLPRDPGILRAAAQHNHANVGVYASVVTEGSIRRGDEVRLV